MMKKRSINTPAVIPDLIRNLAFLMPETDRRSFNSLCRLKKYHPAGVSVLLCPYMVTILTSLRDFEKQAL